MLKKVFIKPNSQNNDGFSSHYSLQVNQCSVHTETVSTGDSHKALLEGSHHILVCREYVVGSQVDI